MENSKSELAGEHKSEISPARQPRSTEGPVVDATFRVLSEVLGETVVEAFEAYLVEMNVSYKSLRDKLEILCSSLDSVFGKDSKNIQGKIARKIFDQLDLEFTPVEGKTLVDYVEQANREIAQNRAG